MEKIHLISFLILEIIYMKLSPKYVLIRLSLKKQIS